MDAVFTVLFSATAVALLVCCGMVLVEIFRDQEEGGIAKGLVAIATCGFYALIWGWQHHEKHENIKLMQVWTVLIAFFVLLRISSLMLM